MIAAETEGRLIDSSTDNENRLKEVSYTPDSALMKPLQLLRSMLKDLGASRGLAWRLTVRDISSQYRQSLLGYVWAFMSPAVTAAVWVFLNSQGIVNVGATDIPYPVYVMIGITVWYGMVDAIKMPLGMVVESKAMLTKVNFPREALIVSGLYQVLFRTGLRFILLFCVFLWFGVVPASTVVLSIGASIIAILFGLMIGIILTPAGVLYNDVEKTVAIVTSIWFFLTPVVYPVPASGLARVLVTLNPATPLVSTARELMTSGTMTQPLGFGIVTAATLLLTLFGWMLYRISMPYLVERMHA